MPSQAAALVANSVAENTEWVFYGKWLAPQQPDDARILANPVALVRLAVDSDWQDIGECAAADLPAGHVRLYRPGELPQLVSDLDGC